MQKEPIRIKRCTNQLHLGKDMQSKFTLKKDK
jgi:hypothetical protein